MKRSLVLPWLMLLYAALSLLHFLHNALYVQNYPNLPRWITPGLIYASWCAIAATGALGYWLYRRVSQPLGLCVMGCYALLGFGGLDHYVLAPVGAHSIVMNASIIAEVSAASVLLIFLLYSLVSLFIYNKLYDKHHVI
jgi:hypothetical protein